MEEDRLYWDSRKQLGVRVSEANGTKYLGCILDLDAWIDSHIGGGRLQEKFLFHQQEMIN